MVGFSVQSTIFIVLCVVFLLQILFAGNVNSVALKALSYHTAVEGVKSASRMMSSALRGKAASTAFSFGFLRFPVLFEFSGMAIISMMCASVTFEAILRMNFSSVFNDIVVNSQDLAIPSGPNTSAIAIISMVFASLNMLMFFLVDKCLRPLERLHTFARSSDPSPSSYFVWILGTEVRVHLSMVAIVFVLLCSWLVTWTGYGVLDSVGALGCVCLIVPILDGLIRKTAPILLQSAPAGPRAAFDRGCREVSTFEGVVECSNEHFWIVADGVETVGTIVVKVRPGVDSQEILAKVRNRLSGAVSELTVQIEGTRPQTSL